MVVEKSRQGPERNSRLITYTTQEEQQAIVDNIFKIQNAFKKNTSKASLSTTEKHFIKPTTEKRNIILKNQEKLDEVMDDDNSTDFTILRPLSKEQIDDFIIIKSQLNLRKTLKYGKRQSMFLVLGYCRAQQTGLIY